MLHGGRDGELHGLVRRAVASLEGRQQLPFGPGQRPAVVRYLQGLPLRLESRLWVRGHGHGRARHLLVHVLGLVRSWNNNQELLQCSFIQSLNRLETINFVPSVYIIDSIYNLLLID